MKRKSLRVTLSTALLLVAFVVAGVAPALAAESKAMEPGRRGGEEQKGIVVEPRHYPEPVPDYYDFVNIWTDRRTYYDGDAIRVYFKVSRSAYVYIFNTDSHGVTRQIFPNYYDRSPSVSAGRTYSIPDSSYRLTAVGPSGMDNLHIVAYPRRCGFMEGYLSFRSAEPYPARQGGARAMIELYKKEAGKVKVAPRAAPDSGAKSVEPRSGAKSVEPRSGAAVNRRIEDNDEQKDGWRITIEADLKGVIPEPPLPPRFPEPPLPPRFPEPPLPPAPRIVVVEEPRYDYLEDFCSFRIVAQGSHRPLPRDDQYPPPRHELGRMRVSSSPSYATVYVNDSYVGRTPLTLDELRYGSYLVRIERPGYRTEENWLRITSPATRIISVALRPERQWRAPDLFPLPRPGGVTPRGLKGGVKELEPDVGVSPPRPILPGKLPAAPGKSSAAPGKSLKKRLAPKAENSKKE